MATFGRLVAIAGLIVIALAAAWWLLLFRAFPSAASATCADFIYQEEAAEAFDAYGHAHAPGLDRNRNGVACDEAGLPRRAAQLAHPGQTLPPDATPATMIQVAGDLGLRVRAAHGTELETIELAGLEPLATRKDARAYPDPDQTTLAPGCPRFLSFKRIGSSVMHFHDTPLWVEPDPGSGGAWVWFLGRSDAGPYLLNEVITRSGSARVTEAGHRSRYGARLAAAEAAARSEATGFWGSCGKTANSAGDSISLPASR